MNIIISDGIILTRLENVEQGRYFIIYDTDLDGKAKNEIYVRHGDNIFKLDGDEIFIKYTDLGNWLEGFQIKYVKIFSITVVR